MGNQSSFTIGIDEVGRGCWAGPLLVVAARQRAALPAGIADSKVLTKRQRLALFEHIQLACELGEGWVSAAEIDHLGLSAAMRLGVKRALTALKAQPDESIVIDGTINYCPAQYEVVTTLIKADATVPLVSCASIYAKVRRDTHMANLEAKYSHYQFERHVGYGTALHRQMLEKYGVSDLHRLSYKPVALLVQ